MRVHIANKENFLIWARSDGYSMSQWCCLGWRIQTKCQTSFFWRRGIDSNGFGLVLMLPLAKSCSQVGGHLLFLSLFLLIKNNKRHQPIHPCFYFVAGKWRRQRRWRRLSRRWRRGSRRRNSCLLDETSDKLLLLGRRMDNGVGSWTTSSWSLPQCSFMTFLLSFL